jgi:lipoate-protein ligase A
MTVRQLPYCVADGPWQMAADEVLLHAAAGGQASFRLYGWSEPTVSLGYFQSHFTRGQELSELPYVRRPTGGMTLVHHHEITYALALPPQFARQPAAQWLEQVHRLISVLAELGVRTELAAGDTRSASETALCFHHVTRGDLTLNEAKVVGSAQRRQRGALLQHGAVLLDTSPFTPTLPGITPLTGRMIDADAFRARFTEAVGHFLNQPLESRSWSDEEQGQIARLAQEKYRSAHWNDKR